MAVQMTRAEYEKKYGTSAPVANAPVKMTRAEYEAKYGSQEPQQQDGFVRSLAKDALKTLVVKPAVRFGQAVGTPVAQALGADPAKLEQELARPTDVNIPLLGNIRVEGQKGLDSGGRMQILGDAAKQASYLAPYGRIAQGASKVAAPVLGKAAGLAGGVASGALGGYAADVGNQIEAGDENPFRPNVGTAIGAAFPIALAAIGKGVNKVASMTPKAKMQGMAQELSSVKNALEKNTRNGISPIDTLTKNKYIPEVANGKIDTTAAHQKIADAIYNLATSIRGVIDDFTNKGAVVNLNKFADDLFTTIKSNPDIKASGKVSKVLAQAQNMIDDYRLSYGENVPVNAIDDIRKAMNRVFDPEHYDVERAFGNAARSVIYDMVPNARETLKKEAELIAAQDFLKSLHGKAIKGGKLGRYFGDIVGAIAGSNIGGGMLGPLAGMLGPLAGVAANRGLNAVRGATYFLENPLAGAASKAQGVKLQSLGDAFLDTNMGKAVTKSLKNPPVGLSINDVSKEGVPSAGTKSSKPSTVTNTSTSNVPTDVAIGSKPKTATLGGVKGVPSAEAGLIAEAKKYKSAEEFVKAQGAPIYRGEGGSNVAQGKALLAEGKHFASDSKYPQGFGQVSENVIKPNAKVLDLGDSTFAEISQKLGIPERRYISPKELSTIAKEKGYDVLKYNGEYKSTGKQFTHFVDLTGESTITKSQLTEIWKKANK